MFFHTHYNVSGYFNRALEDLSKLRPINLCGLSGVGKVFYIKEFIRNILCNNYTPYKDINSDYSGECNCYHCNKIIRNEFSDLLILDENLNTEDARNLIIGFIDSYPKESPYKFLVVPNIENYLEKKSDILLKVFEEHDDYLKIFTTSNNLNLISKPILSRLNSIHCNLSIEDLKKIMTYYNTYSIFLSRMGGYDYKSLDQVIWCNKFRFDDFFQESFMNFFDSFKVNILIKELVFSIENSCNNRFKEVISFLLNYFTYKVINYCDINKDNVKLMYFKDYFENRILPEFNACCFQYINSREYYLINLPNQVFNYISLINMVKKIVGV